eukprot:SM000409S15233  [mRNA]  locus=s409:17601:18322:+ [translate_table: standard]
MRRRQRNAAFQRLREIEAVNGGWAMLGLTSGIVVEGVAGQGILAQVPIFTIRVGHISGQACRYDQVSSLAWSIPRGLEGDYLPWWMLPHFHQALSHHSHPVALSPSMHPARC